MSAKYTLNKTDGQKILMVLLYSGLSGVITALLTIVPQIDLPTAYAPLVLPMVNALLVAGKKFVEKKISE